MTTLRQCSSERQQVDVCVVAAPRVAMDTCMLFLLLVSRLLPFSPKHLSQAHQVMSFNNYC